MGYITSKLASILLPAHVAEQRYTSDRGVEVDYDDLNYEIHICTLNEEEYIEETLQSLARQDPVENGDVPIVLIDSHSNDETVSKARPYVDDVILAPKGLLTARNKGIEERNADVILSADAGDIYSSGWVDELAKPFENDKVVAAYGNLYSKDILHTRRQKLKHSVVNTWNLPGNNSAIRVSSLKETGLFDDDINQQKLVEVLLKEQIIKKAELMKEGKIAYRPYAAIYKCQRRATITTEDHSRYKKQQEASERF